MPEKTGAETVTILVDEQEYTVPAGILLIDAITDYVDFDMPRFCHHSRLDPVGMCRMCMAEVENRGRWMNVATCTMRVADGMKVRVMSPAAVQARTMTLELLLINHPLDCPVCDKGGECMLQDQTVDYGPEVARTIEPRRKYLKPIPISREVLLDRERCVHCARCTRFVDELAGEKTIELINRGYHTEISPAFDGEYDSHFAGNTCDICPVGALTSTAFRFRSRPWEMEGRKTISPFDACGSNLRLDVRENVVRRIMPWENLEVNDLWISDKERFHHEVILDDARLDVPLVRNPDSGELEPATFEDALSVASEGLAKAVRDGRRVAGVGGTLLSCEDQYLFGKFVRTVLGSNDLTTSHPVDYAARAGLVPTYGRLEQAKTFFFGGANPLAEMPIAWLRMYKAIRKKGAQLLTLNNLDRHIDLATSFNLACERGQEATIVEALAGYIYGQKLHDPNGIRPHSRGLGDVTGDWPTDLEQVAAETGVEAGRLRELAQRLAESEDLVIVSPQVGGRSDGAAIRDALWNLALLLNLPGQAHGGWVEHVHNCNGRGAESMGLTPTFAAAERWGVALPPRAGLDLDGILEAGDEFGAMIAIGSDLVSDQGTPFQEVRNLWLNQSHNGAIRETFEAEEARRAEALEKFPFLVVSDLFLTRTARLADVVLPATCFAERAGTYLNLEGRAQYAPAAVRPILGVRHDGDIINALAEAVAARLGDARPWRSLDSAGALREIQEVVPGWAEISREALAAGPGVRLEFPPPNGKYEFVAQPSARSTAAR